MKKLFHSNRLEGVQMNKKTKRIFGIVLIIIAYVLIGITFLVIDSPQKMPFIIGWNVVVGGLFIAGVSLL